jgi:DNA polymerase III sliding clamp (beta) subunit (PCNA family)
MLQGADCFSIRNNAILAYNDFIAVSVPFTSDLSCAIPATSFYKAIAAFKAGDVSLVQEEGKIKIACGRAKAEFTTIEEHIYQRFLKIMPDAPDWKDLPVNFNNIVKSGILKSVPNGLEGVFFHGFNMLSTNNTIVINIDIGMNMERIWLNNKAAMEITKLPMLEKYCTNSSWVHFKAGDVVFSCRKLLDENYPDGDLLALFDGFIQNESAINGAFPPELGDVLRRAAVFSEEINDSHVVNCAIEGTILTVSSSKSIGSFNETVEIIRNDKSDEKVEWAADIAQFKTAFENNPKASFFVSKMDKRRAMVFQGDKWRQLVGLLGDK